jgi:flagellar basal-body rod protein FlgC
MGYFKASEISAAGMLAQKARLEASALNLANMSTSIAPGTEGYRPLTALIRSMPAARLHGPAGGFAPLLARAELVAQAGVVPRTAYEPGHPHADAAGMVSYPGVDHTREMLTVMTALRAYEANLTVLQVTRQFAAKALEIGGR